MINLIQATIPEFAVSVVAFVFLIGVLVIIHEYGHYIMAKRGGVRVDEFSIGFGPLLWHMCDREETAFNLRALPIGGYVRMAGMEPGEGEVEGEEPLSAAEAGRLYNSKSVGVRASIISAGAIINLIFGFLLIVALGLTYGLPDDSRTLVSVSSVKPGTAAARAGILKGDRILEVNGKPVNGPDALHDAISSSVGKPVELGIERSAAKVRVSVVPDTIKVGSESRGQLGILMGPDYVWVRQGLGSSIKTGAERSYSLAAGILKTLVRRETWAKRELGGPVAIAQEAGGTARKGLNYYLLFMAVFSINLGVLNLLPLPVLDGGHLVLLAVEGVRRKKLPANLVIAYQSVGVAILAVFFIFIMYSDLQRMFGKG
ncbi:MAG TPA: M50 family metallopeptidase [Armatimonadota bacterium]|jgi:regulator of sigma E protease